jgi:hypothetical protein
MHAMACFLAIAAIRNLVAREKFSHNTPDDFAANSTANIKYALWRANIAANDKRVAGKAASAQICQHWADGAESG